MLLIVKLTKQEVDQIVKKAVQEKYKQEALRTNALFHQKSFDGYEVYLNESDESEPSSEASVKKTDQW